MHPSQRDGRTYRNAQARVREIRFESCPGSDLSMECVHPVDGELGSGGVPRDAWWRVRCKGIPDRFIRLFDGEASLRGILQKYAFQNATGCVHQSSKWVHASPHEPYALSIPPVSAPWCDMTGVPQFFPNSGICWFATLCAVTFANPEIASIVIPYLPSEAHAWARRSVFDRAAALKLRNFLYERYRVGDNIRNPPEMDGKNGAREFMVLCAKLRIPVRCLTEEDGYLSPSDLGLQDQDNTPVSLTPPQVGADGTFQRHILIVRFHDGDHKRCPMARTLTLPTTATCPRTRYSFCGIYNGAKRCGHQIGVTRLSPMSAHDEWYGIFDADFCTHPREPRQQGKRNTGPIFVRIRANEPWWPVFKYLTHVTRVPGGMCLHSIHNLPDHAYDTRANGSGSKRKGTLSCDWVGVSVP